MSSNDIELLMFLGFMFIVFVLLAIHSSRDKRKNFKHGIMVHLQKYS